MTDRLACIMHVIESNPGICFREIMRRTGLKNGVLSHHLRSMECNGRIRVMRRPRHTAYSAPGINAKELQVASTLQRPTPRRILLALAAQDGCGFSDIAKICGKAPSTVCHYIADLVKNGLVASKGTGSAKRYYINCRDEVDRLVETYHPRTYYGAMEGLDDIIGSL